MVAGQTIHYFASSANLACTQNATVQILVVAGGGGGISGDGNRSGAGGVVYHSSFSLTAGTTYSVTVGAGGSVGLKGGDSVFGANLIVAYGGGTPSATAVTIWC